MQTYDVCSVPIAAVTIAEAADLILAAAQARHRLEVHLCNAFTLSLVDSDPELRSALSRSDLNLPDGTPVAALGRAVGVRSPVRGPALVEEVVRRSDSHVPHFLYGAGPGIAAAMASRLKARYPQALFAGTESPPYSRATDQEVAALAERVTASGARILWIGLGTPAQDYFVPRVSQVLSIPVIPVGAAFDFLAGSVPEAPTWMHGSGLEWTYRLAKEPRRLWRRYLIGNPRFTLSVWRHRRHASRAM